MRRCLFVVGVCLAAALAVPATPAEEKKGEGQWVQLFNGKDLTGWKVHPKPSGGIAEVLPKTDDFGKVVAYEGKVKSKDKEKDGKVVPLWRVENGILIGSGPASHLFSERGDYENFFFRVEARIADKSNSGQYFRTEFGPGFPKGYEAQINSTHGDKIRTGSLYPSFRKMPNEEREKLLVYKQLVKPDEWFTQEVMADGNHIVIRVNGETTVDWRDESNTYKKGHFALQQHDPGSSVQFRKIEVKELPASK